MTIAIDFETHLISNEAPIPAPVCLSWALSDGTTGLEVGRENMLRALRRVFNYERRIVAHNLKFELLVIYTHFPELREQLWDLLEQPGRFFCTMLYEVLLSNISRKEQKALNLAALLKKYRDIDISSSKGADTWRMRYSELENVPVEEWPEAAKSYAIEDSIYCLQVYFSQKEVNAALKVHEHIKADFTLNLMASTGMTIAKDRVLLLEKELAEAVAEPTKYLVEQGFMYFKKNGDPKKNVKKFREHIINNFQNLEYTASKQVSTSGESLHKYLLEKEDPVIQNFLEVVAKEKIKTAFVERLKEADPLIRTNYNAIVRSGRTSSRTSDTYPSVNIQQMPRTVGDVTYDIRACFVPRPGFELVSIDYSALELSATANQLTRVFGKSKMADIINGGDKPVDMHAVLACKIMSIAKKKYISYDEFMAHKKEPEYKAYRQLAKPINLGFPGGIGYDTMRHLLAKDGISTKFEILERSESERFLQNLAYNLKIKYSNIRVARTGVKEWSLAFDELVGLKSALFDLYPELGKFLRDEHARYTTGDYIAQKNEWGQWETEPAYGFDTSGVQRSFCTYTSFCNGFLMQTPSAAGAKDAVYQIVKKYFADPDCNPLAFIHDEIIFEVRVDSPRKFEIIDSVAELMISSMQRALPHVRIAVEASLMDHWTKSGGKWEAQYWRNAKSTVLNKKEI